MTYFTTLKLSKEPFSTSPDPNFFFRSMEHTTALNRLEIAIRLKRGLSLILGDVGTGKTTLSRALLRSFTADDDDYIFHMILDPDFKSEYQFLAHLTKLFGLTPFFRSTIDYREAIEKYLFQKCIEEHKTVVLLIDEGQKLSMPLLEILRTLLNYETNEQKMLQLVILSQMELLPKVKKIRNFMDRVSLLYLINPLDERETGEMINFRLRQAGYEGEQSIFTAEAVKKIYQYTQGYPRQIALLCHKAMEYLIMESRESVTGDVVDNLILEDMKWKWS